MDDKDQRIADLEAVIVEALAVPFDPQMPHEVQIRAILSRVPQGAAEPMTFSPQVFARAAGVGAAEHPAHTGHEYGGAYARAGALAAGDPDWMNATGGSADPLHNKADMEKALGLSPSEPTRCICDGGSNFTEAENRARIPFITNNDCPIHGHLHRQGAAEPSDDIPESRQEQYARHHDEAIADAGESWTEETNAYTVGYRHGYELGHREGVASAMDDTLHEPAVRRVAPDPETLAFDPGRDEFTPTTEQARQAFILGSDEEGSGADFDRWLELHDAALLASGVLDVPADQRVGVVHISTAPDMEVRAELFNEGYEAAMSQHLADDPSAAEDWLTKHDDQVRAEGWDAAMSANFDDSGQPALALTRNPYRKRSGA